MFEAGARTVVLVAVCAAGCATAHTREPSGAAPAPPSSLPPLPRSSIAAVVQHRDELGLTDEQVRQLELFDQRREAEDATIRDEVAKREAAKKAPASSSGGAPSSSGPGTATGSGGGMRGAGMGGGGMGMGGMRGGGMRGGRMPRAAAGGTKANPEASPQDRMDENDTKAYLDAEEVLTEEQRAKARDIAESYREQLYDRRAAAASASSSSK